MTQKKPKPKPGSRSIATMTVAQVYAQLQPFLPVQRQPDLLELYKAACVAHSLRTQELNGTTVRGHDRRRVVRRKTGLLAGLLKREVKADFLWRLAAIRDAWPTTKQFVEEIVKPPGRDGHKLSQTDVIVLAALNKDEEVELRQKLTAQAIREGWSRLKLWEAVRDGRRALK
jgi:hypothetical protein